MQGYCLFLSTLSIEAIVLLKLLSYSGENALCQRPEKLLKILIEQKIYLQNYNPSEELCASN